MKPRLLIDSAVLAFMGQLKKRDRDFLMARFERIRDFPAQHADYQSADEKGRSLDVHIAGRFAVIYWDDAADGHLKIMDVAWADDVV